MENAQSEMTWSDVRKRSNQLPEELQPSDCIHCDGFGVMTLFPQEIECPCLECSGDSNLTVLYAKANKALAYLHRLDEKARIAEHNKRLKNSD